MNKMSVHFNDYVEKSEKKLFFVLKYKYCYAQVLEPDFRRIKRENMSIFNMDSKGLDL